MCTIPIHEVPTYTHQPSSHPSMVGAPLCAHHTPFPLTFSQFSCPQVLPGMFQIQSHCCIWTQSPTLSPTAWSDPSSTLAPEALLLGGWHTHWGPTTTLQLPLAMFHSHTHAHLHFWPDHHIWTCLSIPAIPVPRAVWPTTSPKKPSFQLIGPPITCPPPPISLSHPIHAPTPMSPIPPHSHISISLF